MPDAAENRLTASLTMCRKAGRLLLGFDAVKDAVQQGSVMLILLAADASAKTEKEIRFYAGKLPVRKLPLDMDTLKLYFRKRTAVFGVCEEGFAAKLMLLCPESES
ncbi:MAG: 50S ribosomal protein L7ae [Oscillospiraceae bacterium]|nr:50S ribosomal protein L7ae [Oscillospiraceae bacterium]